jgi:hypothetical protein
LRRKKPWTRISWKQVIESKSFSMTIGTHQWAAAPLQQKLSTMQHIYHSFSECSMERIMGNPKLLCLQLAILSLIIRGAAKRSNSCATRKQQLMQKRVSSELFSGVCVPVVCLRVQ